MLKPICSAIGAILIAFFACGPALATMCNEIDQKRYNNLTKLYEYAQIVDNPEDSKSNNRIVCKVDKDITVPVQQPELMEVIIPMEFIKEVEARAEQWMQSNERPTSRMFLKFTNLDSDDSNPQFSIGCYGEKKYENDWTEIAFNLSVKIIGRNALFYLAGAGLKTTIINRDTGETIIVTPGTDLSKLREIRANIVGEDCVFPIVHITVDALCEALSHNDSHLNYVFKEQNKDIFMLSSRSLTMIGHSLGGSATQYVASNLPRKCILEGGFNGFKAFAFSSPGLKSGEVLQNTDALKNFIINGDWLLKRAFLDRSQLGEIEVFTPPSSQMLCLGHSIDQVQNGICSCLQQDGAINKYNFKRSNREILTDERCEGYESIDQSG